MADIDYRVAFETAAEAQLIVDAAGNVVNASDHYLHVIGRSRDDVLGRSLYDLPPYAGSAESCARLRDALAAMVDAGLQIGAVHLTAIAGAAALPVA